MKNSILRLETKLINSKLKALEAIKFCVYINYYICFISKTLVLKKLKPENTILKLLLLIVLINGYSCGLKKVILQKEELIESNPKLIFLNYNVSETKNGETEVAFINKKITDGKLKNYKNNFIESASIGDLKCMQLDENSNPIQSEIIKNPLIQTVEFVNDSLFLKKKQIHLKSTQLALKLQLHSKTKSITISKITDSLQNSKALIKTIL